MGKIRPDQIEPKKAMDMFHDFEVTGLCQYLEKGNSIRTACRCMGIPERRVYDLKRWGSRLMKYTKSYFRDHPGIWNNRERIMEIYQKLEKAEEYAKVRCTNFILQAAENDWKAAAWYLERKHGKEFGKQESITVKTKNREEENKELMREIVAIIEKEGDLK